MTAEDPITKGQRVKVVLGVGVEVSFTANRNTSTEEVAELTSVLGDFVHAVEAGEIKPLTPEEIQSKLRGN